MKALRRALCAVVTLALLLAAALPVSAEGGLPVTEAFVQGESLYVYLPLEEELTAELNRGGVPLPAVRGVEAAPESGLPVSYYLLVDNSNSMRSMRGKVRSFASALVQASPAGTRFSVLTFSDSLRVAQEKTQVGSELLDCLDALSYDVWGTDLPDGVMAALDYLESGARETGELVNVVVLSDGVTEEAAESPGLAAAQERAGRASSVLVHTVGFATSREESAEGLSSLAAIGAGVHEELAWNVWDATAAAQSVADSTAALSVLTFDLGAAQSKPFGGDIFFLAADTGELRYRAELEEVPVLAVGDPGEPPAASSGSVSSEPPAASLPPVESAGSEPPAAVVSSPEESGEQASAPGESAPEDAVPSQPGEGSAQSGEADGGEAPADGEEVSGSLPGWVLPVCIGGGVVLAALIAVLAVLLIRRRRRPASASCAASATAPGPVPAPRGASGGIYMRLEVIAGSYEGKTQEFSLTGELIAGSDRDCDLVWSGEGVSPRHARIFLRDGLIFLEDLGSEEGTLLGGMRLHEANRLRSGDEITLGSARFRMKF